MLARIVHAILRDGDSSDSYLWFANEKFFTTIFRPPPLLAFTIEHSLLADLVYLSRAGMVLKELRQGVVLVQELMPDPGHPLLGTKGCAQVGPNGVRPVAANVARIRQATRVRGE